LGRKIFSHPDLSGSALILIWPRTRARRADNGHADKQLSRSSQGPGRHE
jgi:hypothetical protein